MKNFAEKLKNFTYSRLVPFILSYVIVYTCFTLVFRQNANPYIFLLFWGVVDSIMGLRDLISQKVFDRNVGKSKENPDTLFDKYFLLTTLSIAAICGIVLIWRNLF